MNSINISCFDAARVNNKDAIKGFLAQQTFDVNAKNNIGETMLHIAVWYMHRESVALLLKDKRTDVNARCDNRRTPLHGIARRSAAGSDIKGESTQVALALLEHPNIFINAKDKSNKTAFMIAEERGAIALAQILLSYGADMEDQEKHIEHMFEPERVMRRARREQLKSYAAKVVEEVQRFTGDSIVGGEVSIGLRVLNLGLKMSAVLRQSSYNEDQKASLYFRLLQGMHEKTVLPAEVIFCIVRELYVQLVFERDAITFKQARDVLYGISMREKEWTQIQKRRLKGGLSFEKEWDVNSAEDTTRAIPSP